jgi:hypothetical protein
MVSLEESAQVVSKWRVLRREDVHLSLMNPSEKILNRWQFANKFAASMVTVKLTRAERTQILPRKKPARARKPR